MQTKQAILTVSFGTSYAETREKTIGAIEADIGEAFPSWEVRRAFTSGMILKKLKARDGIHIDSVQEALERLRQDGFETALIQPTHLLNGEEYDDIVRDAEPFRDSLPILWGKPLLSATEDYQSLTSAVSQRFPRRDGQAVCLMGHGTSHPADSAYAALEYHFRDLGRPDIFVGVVEGYPDFDAMARRVREYGAESLTLTPLMVVAGDHAINDMASGEEGSWRGRLTAMGFTVDCVLRGLGEYPEIRRMYVDHVRAGLKS